MAPPPSAQSLASVAEYHPAQFIAEAFGFFRVGSVAKTLGQFKELLLFPFLRFDAVLDQLDEHAIGAEPACLSQAAYLRSGFCGKGHALAHRLDLGLHEAMVHHSAPICTSVILVQAVGAVAQEFEQPEVPEDLELLADFVANVTVIDSTRRRA